MIMEIKMYIRSLKAEKKKASGVAKTIKLHEIDPDGVEYEDAYISVCGKIAMSGNEPQIILTEMVVDAEICKNCSSKLAKFSKKKKGKKK